MFGRKWGYNVSPHCLPQSISQIYCGLPIGEQTKILLALIENKTEDEAFDLVDADAIDTAKESTVAETFRLTCPAEGCGLTIGGDVSVEKSRAAMADRVRRMRADRASQAS